MAVAWALALASLGHSADSFVKIGVQIPLTGERSAVGRLMGNGLQMAVDAINGRTGSTKVELVFADDASTPEGALEAINDLVKDPQIVCIIGEINSPLVLASVPVINAEKTSLSDCRNKSADDGCLRVDFSRGNERYNAVQSACGLSGERDAHQNLGDTSRQDWYPPSTRRNDR